MFNNSSLFCQWKWALWFSGNFWFLPTLLSFMGVNIVAASFTELLFVLFHLPSCHSIRKRYVGSVAVGKWKKLEFTAMLYSLSNMPLLLYKKRVAPRQRRHRKWNWNWKWKKFPLVALSIGIHNTYFSQFFYSFLCFIISYRAKYENIVPFILTAIFIRLAESHFKASSDSRLNSRRMGTSASSASSSQIHRIHDGAFCLCFFACCVALSCHLLCEGVALKIIFER